MALGILSAAPEALADHVSIKCSASGNACEEVDNAYQGSDYVYWVYVWDGNSPNLIATYRLLFDGYPRYSKLSLGGPVFQLNYYVNSGRCIQGGVEGLPDARTPCWVAP
jgi:hypothetical protein